MSGSIRSAVTPLMATAAPFLRFGRGKTVAMYGGIVSKARLPSDSIGNFTLTLTNVVVGSVIRVEFQSGGATVASATASSSIVSLVIPAYSAGNANNSLRVKVRKGSASPYYQPYETLVTAFVGSQSVYVSQISDE